MANPLSELEERSGNPITSHRTTVDVQERNSPKKIQEIRANPVDWTFNHWMRVCIIATIINQGLMLSASGP